MLTLGQIITSYCGLGYHFYADDTYLYHLNSFWACI